MCSSSYFVALDVKVEPMYFKSPVGVSFDTPRLKCSVVASCFRFVSDANYAHVVTAVNMYI